MNSFEGKVALVTGAGSGLGLATAKAFAIQGASVVLADINEEAIKEEVKKLNDDGYQAISIKCDVSNEEEVKNMMEKIVETFGKLDAAFNNSGVMNNVEIETADYHLEEYDRIMNVNLKGVWLCLKYEILQMKKQKSGTIVNCSSIAGIAGSPGRSIYSATKHAVLGLTKSSAMEYAPKGIRINAVSPGTFETPMVNNMVEAGGLSREVASNNAPLKRLGRSEELADAVLWLSSPDSSYVVGQSIGVDGGVTA